MADGTSFEARLADAYLRYVDAAPVDVDARALAVTVAMGTRRRRLGWPAIVAPGRRVGVILAVGLVAALLSATVLLVAGRLVERQHPHGLLAYELNDDIFLSDEDGSNPRTVADGVAWSNDTGGGPAYLFGDGGPVWAPDGRHFLFFDIQGAAGRGTGHIADGSGRIVASIPDIWVDATWSADSTRIEAWTAGNDATAAMRIGIYGLDGMLQASLPLPAGYMRAREYPGTWARDGRSVYVRLGQGGGPLGVWQLPLDGSAARKLAQDDLIARADAEVSDSPDDRHLLANVAGVLFVANADGTDPRPLDVAGAFRPIWSPDGARIAYMSVPPPGGPVEIRVVDVGSGSDRGVVPGLQVNGPGLLGWSSDGTRVLFAAEDPGGSSLSSIGMDGTNRKVLVPGSSGGAWQVPSGS